MGLNKWAWGVQVKGEIDGEADGEVLSPHGPCRRAVPCEMEGKSDGGK